ncbi:hypothetical protein O181_042554 [Austropuccinia psidii MF-1]|uniref:Uncharacterized protein n=1 Tax=Austropuccinia psidii MF-1 TaxID=1389203 RepID=A0A9Q3HHK5_9BASI|nr:hypothetical protein [Austropuccinia psidii MF-1]
MPLMPLTILTLAVPSQHASNSLLTLAYSSRPLMILTLLKPPQDETTTLPSPPLPYILGRFPSLCSRSTHKICLRRHPQPPLRPILSPPLTILMLRYYIHRVWWLVGVHDERNQGDMLSGHLCQQVLGGNW